MTLDSASASRAPWMLTCGKSDCRSTYTTQQGVTVAVINASYSNCAWLISSRDSRFLIKNGAYVELERFDAKMILEELLRERVQVIVTTADPSRYLGITGAKHIDLATALLTQCAA